MNLIDKYIVEVAKHLPRKNRADIEAEIRSTLEDMLEERSQGPGPADEATVLALLKEYGAPREVAAKYKTHQYLIGPRLFPIFEKVLRIVIAVVFGASLIGLGTSLAQTNLTGPDFVAAISKWIGGLITGLIGAFGNVALIFAIIERTKAADEFEKDIRDWDPKELQKEHDPDEIDKADHIGTIIFSALALIVFNIYPELFSVRYPSSGAWVTMPILTSLFFSFLPWINLMALLQIVYSSFMLGQKYWTTLTRILDIVLDLAGMLLAVVILNTPGITTITPAKLAAMGFVEGAEELSRLFSFVPTIIIIVIVVVTTINIIKHLIRLFSGKSRSPYPVSR
ncbi:MAG: HAAS signaling domain-containing protein [Syntrophothermus sp.]